jgi:nicotinate-nucleotide pyrophosphorylase (carboxylating)
MPFSAFDCTGTPSTGKPRLGAGRHAGQMRAAPPAPAMMAMRAARRDSPAEAYSNSRSGVRCAETTRTSAANTRLCRIEGAGRGIVSAERCALNFLQTMSGTATTTRRYADALAHSKTRVLDTRKTLPGLRLAQKYAVRCGGGTNHRIGLFDAVLIKENHIATAGSIAAAIANARTVAGDRMVEIEVENLREFGDALAARPDRIMLDELSDEDVRTAVRRNAGQVELELSGGVSFERLAEIAELGVDFVSVGALTKHVRAVDLSLRVLRRW